MPARRLEIGEHGAVRYTIGGDRVTASMYYRNGQGQRRRVDATAGREDGGESGGDGLVSSCDGEFGRGRLHEPYDVSRCGGGVVPAVSGAGGSWSPFAGSAELYRATLDRHVLPAIGGLRLRELTTARLDAFLHGVLQKTGHATAKVCRSVTSGVCGFAARRDGLPTNPVRDVGNLERTDMVRARALSADEAQRWLAVLDADSDAVRQGSSGPCAVPARALVSGSVRRWVSPGPTSTLISGLVHVRRTIVRVKGSAWSRSRRRVGPVCACYAFRAGWPTCWRSGGRMTAAAAARVS